MEVVVLDICHLVGSDSSAFRGRLRMVTMMPTLAAVMAVTFGIINHQHELFSVLMKSTEETMDQQVSNIRASLVSLDIGSLG